MTQQQRDGIALTKIENYIDAQIDDVLQCPKCGQNESTKRELSAAAVALIRSRYDKLRPTLSSVDQTVREEPKTETELIQGLADSIMANPAMLRPLVETNPGVRAALLSLLSGGPIQVETVAGTQQTQCSNAA